MSVSLQHLQCFMACDGRHLHGIQPFFEESAGPLMPEVVECQVYKKSRIRIFPLLFAFNLIGRPSPAHYP